MNAETISKIFNVFPHSIVLVGDDGTVATPNEDGDFSLYQMSSDITWSLNGDSSKPTENVIPRPSTSYAYQQPMRASDVYDTAKSKWKPSGMFAHHKPPGVTKQESKKSVHGISWTKTVEICRFDSTDMTIKKTFNLPLTLTVTGVGDIASAEAFGGDPVVILDSENLRIPDSIGTRGKYNNYII